MNLQSHAAPPALYWRPQIETTLIPFKRPHTISFRWQFLPRAAAASIFLTVAVILHLAIALHFQTFSIDWRSTYYPASRLVLSGHSPYENSYFQNPVWSLLPLIPLALLGPGASALVFFVLSAACFAFVAWRLGARPLAFASFLLSPLTLASLANGNLEGVALLGLVLPAPVGLFFAAIKPQLGLGMAIYWAFVAWREGGLRRLVLTFMPVALALAACYLLFGNWMAGKTDYVLHGFWNTSFFPWSLPIGAALAWIGCKSRRISTAAAASPFLSPFVGYYSWPITLAALLQNHIVLFVLSAGMWLLILFTGIGRFLLR